jgi:vitamin B12 transporter
MAGAARAQTPAGAPAPDVAGDAAANAADQVVVVAGREAEPLQKVGQSFTVLTLSQIQADQEPVVSDILARTPGVTVTRNGGVGEPTALNIRGADTNQTLVMIDGVKLDDPSSPGGGYNFADLLVGDVSRIEVLRGPQSTLYGSQAIGGVVNIVTAIATRPFEGEAQVEGGSYGTSYLKAAAGGRDGPLSWRLAAEAEATSGVSAFDEKLGGREPDGYRNQGVSGRLGYQITPDVSVDLRGLYTSSHSDFDGFSTPTHVFGDDSEYGKTSETIGYAGLNFTLLDQRLKNRLAVQYSGTDRGDYDPADAPVLKTFAGVGDSVRAEYQGVYAIAPGWRTVFGAEHEEARIEASSPAFDLAGTPPIKAKTTIDSGYGQLQGEVLAGLTLTGGLRYDDHSTFGGRLTGQASAAWSLNGGDTVLRSSWGQGFKAPSLYELYSDYGNTNLRPEQAVGWDAGVEQHLWERRIDLQATYYNRDTTDLITFVDCLSEAAPHCSTGRYGYYDNVQKARAHGVELSGTIRPLAGWSISANYTLTDTAVSSAGMATKVLPRIPTDMANAEIGYAWPFKLTTTIALRYAGGSYNDAANTILLKAYTLADLRASYPVTRRLEVYGRIENLADVHYETDYQYGTLGRAFYIGVRETF